ncbi:MAG: hypothetical protein ACXVP2_12755 [Tumebacillaceae bacterium]
MRFLGLLVCLTLFLIGCSTTSEVAHRMTPVESTISQELQQTGYQVIEAKGKTDEYKLTKDRLAKLPYSMYWGLQATDPTPYIGQTVQVYKFIVTHHPLDNWSSGDVKSKGQTEVYVFYINNKIVGGTSYPVVDEQLLGGYWSLDGKTLEQVQGKSYQTWRKEWMQKLNSMH